MLSKFLRKRKRELQLHTPKVAIPRVMLLPHRKMSASKTHIHRKVPVDEYVVKAMEIETDALLRNQNPSSVVRACHGSLAEWPECHGALRR